MIKNWLFVSVLALMLAMTSVVSHAEGAEEGKDSDRKTEGKEREGKDKEKDSDKAAAADPYSLYKKVGRTWMHKTTVSMQGMDDMISYMKYEITAVKDDHAIYVMTMLDAEKKPNEHVPPTETKIEFVVPEPSDDVDEAPEPKQETVKVGAGEFKCYVSEHNGTKIWMSIKYPGLLVKMEGENISMELVEFKE
jgi:hypothetical protein